MAAAVLAPTARADHDPALRHQRIVLAACIARLCLADADADLRRRIRDASAIAARAAGGADEAGLIFRWISRADARRVPDSLVRPDRFGRKRRQLAAVVRRRLVEHRVAQPPVGRGERRMCHVDVIEDHLHRLGKPRAIDRIALHDRNDALGHETPRIVPVLPDVQHHDVEAPRKGVLVGRQHLDPNSVCGQRLAVVYPRLRVDLVLGDAFGEHSDVHSWQRS